MFTRFRIALAIALLTTMLISVSVTAKGGFAFITITGVDLKEAIRTADGELTLGFFAFADFYRNKTEAPADPGAGYEITRYYVDNDHEVAFDRLHYYPETGFVFYDGIVNGSSEYDGKWYIAKTEIKAAFESALTGTTVAAPSSNQPVEQAQKDPTVQQKQPGNSMTASQLVMPAIATVSLAAVVLILFLSRRNRAVQ